MIFELICFGLFAFAMFVVFILLLEGEDARKIKYYTDKMKRRRTLQAPESPVRAR